MLCGQTVFFHADDEEEDYTAMSTSNCLSCL